MSEQISQKDAVDMLFKMNFGIVPNNLIYFIGKSDLNKINLLLVAGLNPNEPYYDDKSKTSYIALHHAAIFGTPEIIDKLIEYKADINIKDQKGMSPLFSAIKQGKIENVKALIKNAADVNFKSKSKINPLFYSQKNKKVEITEILRQSGAKEMTEVELKAHKKTKIPRYILIGVVIVGLIWIIGSNTFSSSSNCKDNQYEYQEGYASGKLTRVMGGSGSCSEYVDSYNYQTGRNTMHATDCFCDGFEDGLNGRSAKY